MVIWESQSLDTRLPLAFKNDRPPFTEPDRRSQFGRSSFTRHPKLTQETTVYDEQFGRNRPIQIDRSSLADLPPHGANYFSSVRSYNKTSEAMNFISIYQCSFFCFFCYLLICDWSRGQNRPLDQSHFSKHQNKLIERLK
jgi:hypothetical protein